MRQLALSRSFALRIGAAALTLAVAAPAGALAADGGSSSGERGRRQQGYPGQPAPGQTTTTPTQTMQEQRRQQEEQGEIRPSNPSESQKREVRPTETPGSSTGTTTVGTTPLSGTTTAPSSTAVAPPTQAPGQTTVDGVVPPVSRPTTSNTQLTSATPLIQFKDVPTARVGVDPNNTVSLTLHDAVALALQHNLDIEARRIDTQIALFDYKGSKGAYDFNVGGELSFNSSTIPVASIFSGGGADAAVNRKTLTFDGSFSQLLHGDSDRWGFLNHGGVLTGAFNNTRETTDATSTTLNPQFNPQLGVSFSQPLMRNFKIDATRRQIQIAKKNLDLSDSVFRQRVIEVINGVQRSYWDLVYAIRNEQIQRESVELGRVQLENNVKQVEAGTLAPIELRSTEADLEGRKQNVITAIQGITTAENALKALVINDPNDPMWNARIVPAENATFAPIEPDLDSSLRAAIVNRPELEQLKIQTQLKGIDLEYYADQRKPQVDLIASYNLQGLAGSEILVDRSGSNALDPLTTALVASLNEGRALAGLPLFDPTPFVGTTGTTTSTVPERFQGSYFRSLGTLFSNDFRTWSVGVRVNFPLQNTLADANYGRTKAELRLLDAQQRQLISTIQVDVRNALQAADAAHQRYEAATAARVAAEAQLRGEEERFRAGLSTNFLVLDRQNALSAARGSEAAALTDYNKAIADIQRVTGTNVVANNVSIDDARGK